MQMLALHVSYTEKDNICNFLYCFFSGVSDEKFYVLSFHKQINEVK